jgi:hypothetical protein
MFWVIRWTDAHTDQDKSIVVEARSRAEAEYMGLKRGIPIAFLGEATRADVGDARAAKLLWKYTPDAPYTCFGRPVNRGQLAALLLAGLTTVALHLGPTLPHIQL